MLAKTKHGVTAIGLIAVMGVAACDAGGPARPGDAASDAPARDGALGDGASRDDASRGDDASQDAPSADAAREVVSVREIDLGETAAGAALTFEVPPGTLGFHVVAEPVGAPGANQPAIVRLASPSGDEVVRDTLLGASTVRTAVGYYGIAATAVPQAVTPASMPAVEPGRWTVVVGMLDAAGASAAGRLTVRVHVRTTPDGMFHGGELDLELYIPEGLTLRDPGAPHVVSAATAQDDPAVRARVESFYATLMELYGLGRGRVRYHAVDASFVTVADQDAFTALIRETRAVAHGSALHVLLANGVSFGGQETWGVSPGIPGAGFRTGTSASGVVLNVSAGFPARADGQTLVHEMGHFAGLFHTSEYLAGYYDTLTDTPECADAMMGAACADGRNIMFPAFYGASGGGRMLVTSAQQRAVVWGSPLYRGYASGPGFIAPMMLEAPGGAVQDAAGYRASGRALASDVERALAAGLCAHASHARALARAAAVLARPEARAELARLAQDGDLVPVLRRRAAWWLAQQAAP